MTDPEVEFQLEEEIQPSQSAKDYFLMHRRFAYLGTNTIIRLYKVTTHQSIHRSKHRGPCEIYVIGKMKKKITRIVASRKDGILDLILIDVYNPFLKSLIDNTTFLKIVNNHFRKH